MHPGVESCDGGDQCLVYEELRRIAQGLMACERDDHTLTPTALVHEAWTRLESNNFFQRSVGLQYFYCSAATAMRRILVEHARKFERRRTLLKTYLASEQRSETREWDESICIEDIDEALKRLAVSYEQEAKLVELRFFAGLTISQAAEAGDLCFESQRTLAICSSVADSRSEGVAGYQI